MKIKLLTSDVLTDLEKKINEFCEHERIIDVSLCWNNHVWVATIKYQPVIHCDDHVFDKNTNGYQL